MGLTKKDLQEMITESIRDVIIKEIKPLISKTIRQEFYKILNDAGTTRTHLAELKEDDLSISKLLKSNTRDEEKENDRVRQAVHHKIFSGGNRFADILNKTADQYAGRSIGAESAAIPILEQKEFVLNSKSVNNQRLDSTQIASQLGYGDGFKKVGSNVKIPGGVVKSKSAIKKITEEISEQPVTVSLPTKSPDGRPINFDKIPVAIVQNMMKDYSGLLKKMEKKSNFVRGGQIK